MTVVFWATWPDKDRAYGMQEMRTAQPLGRI